MNCPKCQQPRRLAEPICPGCGLVFEKYFARQRGEPHRPARRREAPRGQRREALRALLLDEPAVSSGAERLAKWALWLVLVVYSGRLIVAGVADNAAGEALIHLPNLVFHEAGHVIFGFFGQFIGSLGGTLGQLLMPAICLWTFLFRHRNCFSAAIALWWLAENFVDIAPYINDARAGVLPLLGGNIGKHAPYGFHDWEYLLSETGLLRADHFLAGLSHALGSVLMLLALGWAALLLLRQRGAS